ncbi:uncharacterized protein EI97DRAFT_419522 [Westerdykella ornata]|uniref:Uncharacterized protein n=1 Tax=Westerdykella ornata TaxID=318751 RepID=A0A6A6JIU6_WESOR|nr:uncharacterized protein EI97DRAFT_419522 [Westerdykella ornata]KAF2275878.1 hypothetical protein EI97DRAFT_419522 [Westerdykella ornata]
MSGPSTDGRPSPSPNRSAHSSPTLHSRWSGVLPDNGEGSSSSQRPTLAGSSHSSRAGNEASYRVSEDSGSPLGAESIAQQDFAHRRHKSTRFGGFLLDGTFPEGPRARHRSGNGVQRGRKERQSASLGEEYGHRRSERARNAERESTSSSSLSREVSMQEHDVVDEAGSSGSANRYPDNEQLRARKARREPVPQDPSEEAARPPIDPTQIVQLALSLSESRRRNLSAGQLIGPSQGGSSRVASIARQKDKNLRDLETGGSLRKYLNEQRRVSGNISPFGGRAGGLMREVTDGTLERAAKARAAIELRMEYLRLLDYLPPLKPNAFAPGNYTTTSTAIPGSPYAVMTRIPSYSGKKHALGRPYNPLQYLRNRRTRARERMNLQHTPEEFADAEKARTWVDRVEKESARPDYRREDRVHLPEFDEDHGRDAVPSKPTKHRMGWNFTTEELFADVLWLEQDGNKALIEDRHGHKVFPQLSEREPPKKSDLLEPRASKEYADKRKASLVESLPGVGEPTTGDESEPLSERGRKRRIIPPFRPESPKLRALAPLPHLHTGKGREGRRGTDSEVSSDFELDLSKSKSARHIVEPSLNTGALGLHLEKLLAKEAEGAQGKSPAFVSPDTPDKWGIGFPGLSKSTTGRDSLESAGYTSGSVRGDVRRGLKVPPANRIRREELAGEQRTSLDYSSAPGTPLHAPNLTRVESEPSPPGSRGRDAVKPKKGRLDFFRVDESARSSPKFDSLRHEPSSASMGKTGSRRTNTEFPDPAGLGHAVKSLLTHKKEESISTLGSPNQRKSRDSRESKEPSSAVTRFLKGVKSEGTKVGEFIFKRDRPSSDSESDVDFDDALEGDLDAGEDSSKKNERGLGYSPTPVSTGSKTGNNYHIELPTFRSQHEADSGRTLVSEIEIEDHVTKQARARANSRSPRFDRLAPPRMNLGSISSRSSPGQSPSLSPRPHELERVHSDTIYTRRPSQPGISRASTYDVYSDASSRCDQDHPRPRFASRHWSITDDDPNNPRRFTTAHVPTASDIARIRALFLCSGIKAREIARRAQTKRTEAPAFLRDAAKAANAELIPVARKEEHALAARILVRNLEASTAAVQKSAERYRTHTITELNRALTNVKARVESEMIPRVRQGADEAQRISSEVGAKAPLEVQQVVDGVEKMLRARRRRTRWVTRLLWGVLEWMLLAIMWGVWGVVRVLVVVKMVTAGVGWLVLVIRWLLWV